MELTHFSLFTGIGGLDLAAEWAGFKTIGQCEWADYPTKILEKHWPNVQRWRDVKDVTAKSINKRIGGGRITVLSGGFPCQPHSIAGKRKGSTDERDLWPEFRRIISDTAPKWVLGENVSGIFTTDDRRFFGRILSDLAEMGYFVGWATYGAVHVGARHKRNRVFIVAHTRCSLWQGSILSKADESKTAKKLANNRKRESQPKRCVQNVRGRVGHCSENVFNPTSKRWEKGNNEAENAGKGKAEWESWTADSFNRHIWELEPNVGRVANGVPNRVDRLKCLGNAVVPQQAFPIFKAIYDIEKGMKAR